MKPALPPSETHLPTNILGVVMAFVTIYLLKGSGLTAFDTTLVVLAASVIPVLSIEWLVFRRHLEGRAELSKNRPISINRVLRKYLGLLGILLVFAALYRLIPEYDAINYRNVWILYTAALPIILLCGPVYFAWCDARQDEPEDGYAHLGNALLGKWHGTDWQSIKRLFRNWLVKAFFLPLMFTYCIDSISALQTFSFAAAYNFMGIFNTAFSVIMFVDLLYATLGYIFTLRIFNAHIRSSEPTFLGWFVAIICYAPFWATLFYPHFFSYDDGLNWDNLIPQGMWQYLWGGTILLALTIYSTATVCLGIRFSNLTYRGLVTNGPYRFTKHPAYVAKNLSWWMVSLPFISNEGIEAAITCSVALMGINFIYYIRARTEERHLSNYPEYVEYALAMNERSIFAPLARRLPFLKYKKPENLPKI